MTARCSPDTADAYRRKAEVVKALAHPSRLLMLDALAAGELCVCELQSLVGSDLSTVSKHLSVMRRAGIVADRKQGLKVFYRLKVPCVLGFFACIDGVLRASRDELSAELDGPPVQEGDRTVRACAGTCAAGSTP